jgi:hypothetical protein
MTKASREAANPSAARLSLPINRWYGRRLMPNRASRSKARKLFHPLSHLVHRFHGFAVAQGGLSFPRPLPSDAPHGFTKRFLSFYFQ